MNMGRVVRCVAAATIVVGLALCDAAPRVDIRVIPRPRPEPETPFLGPFPYREPSDPTGPFASYASSAGCITNFPGEIEGKSVMIDLCHLKNVTFLEVPPAVADVTETLEAEGEAAKGEAAAGEAVTSENSPTPVEISQPPLLRRQILGIFRGWKLDPIYKKFKYAIFDDGDLCGEYGTERFSVAVELIRASDYEATPRLYDLRKLSSCSYALRVEAYVSEYEMDASSGIHTPGVVDISDAEEMLPQICGEMKCQYSHVAGRVDVVKQEIESLKKSLEELVSAESTSVAALSVSAATSIIKSSTDVMEKALEMLQSIEKLEQAAHDARAAAAATTKTGTTEVTATS